MSINEVRYLPECGSTNAYVKEHFEEFGPVGAVYTENQTAGRGRLGRRKRRDQGRGRQPLRPEPHLHAQRTGDHALPGLR